MTDDDGGSQLVVPVLVDGWQMECCGTPPSMGAEVSWRLDWAPQYASTLTTGWLLSARLHRLPLPGNDVWREAQPHTAGSIESTVPAVATSRGLSVYLAADVPLATQVTLTGVLHEDHHVDSPVETPMTSGLITRVRLVSWAYELDRSARAWRPRDGSAELTEVSTAPAFLPHAVPGPDVDAYRSFSAILVDLLIRGDEPGSAKRGVTIAASRHAAG